MKEQHSKIVSDSSKSTHVTILINLDHGFEKEKRNELKFRDVKARLNSDLSADDRENIRIMKQLDAALSNSPTDNHNIKGLGIYLLSQKWYLQYFPYEINEGIYMGPKFHVNEIEVLQHIIHDFCIVSMSKKHSRLFTGSFNTLKEVKNDYFPFEFVDEFEHGREHYAFSKDKSKVQQNRFDAYFRELYKRIRSVEKSEKVLFVLSTAADLADFKNVNPEMDILHLKEGSFDQITLADIQELIVEYMTNQKDKLSLHHDAVTGSE